MKTVAIKIGISQAEAEKKYGLLPCYDGIIDGVPSWYGGMIKRGDDGSLSEQITFEHDMPNREWEDWLENAKRVYS